MSFHSEHGQDRWLAEFVFPTMHDGVFVEAGALDGLLHSNTLYFERERGWRGVLIEPIPMAHAALTINRPQATVVGCALGAYPGVAEFMLAPTIGWSGLRRFSHPRRQRQKGVMAIWVPVLPLATVLRGLGVTAVDYLSLDIEGGEFEVLSVFPFAEIPIQVIGVEDNGGANEALRALLRAHGYRHLARVGVDEFWQLGA